MREIGAFEAKNKLSTLLDAVERGETILITRYGKAIARLVPARTSADAERARGAADRIRTRARALKAGAFDWFEWEQHRDDGRP